MNFSRMRRETLLKVAAKLNLPGNHHSMKVGHLRDALSAHLPQYLELWFLDRVRSDLLPLFAPHLRLPARNQCHLPQSKLEFDWSWKSLRIAVEIQGGLKNSRSGHRSEAGVRRDMSKTNLAVLHQWELIHLSNDHITEDHVWASYTLPLLVALVRRKMVWP